MIAILEAQEKQLKGLVAVYKDAFKTHNLFRKDEKFILNYLKKTHKDNWYNGGGYVIAVYNEKETNFKDKIVGACLIVKKDTFGKHSRWRIKHIGVMKDFQNKGIGKELLAEALAKIKHDMQKNNLTTAKIEVHASAKDRPAINFYKKNKFKVEGKLTNRYRFGESAYVFGRTIKR